VDDELKQAWQSQPARPRLTLDTALVLNEVRRNEKQFDAMILCRDLREVVTALIMVPVWIVIGVKLSSLWTWYLTIPTLLWIAAFMLVDRRRQRRRQPVPGDDLRSSVERSLAQVEHQIWLLRNVFWWYLLPPGVAVMIWLAHLEWSLSRHNIVGAIAAFGAFASFFVLVGWFVYWLNQFAVRKQLEPRRKELRELLGSLDETGPVRTQN
jgi:hypothetical protein